MSLVSDEQIRADLVQLTAEFRFRICWAGTRSLIEALGIDPMRCILHSCDQGNDVDFLLMLPDGRLVDCDVQQNPKSREHERFTNWQYVDYVDREYDIARSILGSSDLVAFDREVAAFYEDHWRDRDEALPSIRPQDR